MRYLHTCLLFINVTKTHTLLLYLFPIFLNLNRKIYFFTCSYYSSSRYFSFNLPVNRFLNKLLQNILNDMIRNQPLCSFGSCLINSPTPIVNKPHSLRDETILTISFISLFEIINVVTPDPRTLYLLLLVLMMLLLLILTLLKSFYSINLVTVQ